jgi:uncharacterized protein involved in type VI secretion and phage assembly
MQRENGIMVGIVTELEDEDRIGRVRVRFPHLNDQQSHWARIASPMAGKNRGFYLVPEKDDEVLVGFEMGDPTRPYILGSLWSKIDTPPRNDDRPKENNWRFIQSRSGHILKFDDTKGAEKIELIDKDGTRKVIIDSKNGKIQITCEQGEVEVVAKSVSVKADAVEMHAHRDMTLEAGGNLVIKGKKVDIN